MVPRPPRYQRTDTLCPYTTIIRSTLIDPMDHFSRGQPIAGGPINLYQPIHEAMETARARQFSGVRFAEDFDPSLPLVHGNHDAMVQILLNLLTNGCEALGGRDDGVVRLTTAYRHGLSIEIGRAHV